MIQSEVQGTDSLNTRARRDALAAMATVAVEATGIVNFATSGRLLVIGEDDDAIDAARELPSSLTATVVVLDAPALPSTSGGIVVVTARSAEFALGGHLGDFRAQLQRGGKTATFDLVLDLCREPRLADEWPRFGYHSVPGGGAGLEKAVAEIADQVGEFEKL